MQDDTDVPPAVEAPKPKISKNERFLLILFVVGCLISAVLHTFTAVLHKSEVDEIRDEMQVLADAGQPEAILWVLRNGNPSDKNLADELQLAAETGHPESMYRYALFLGYRHQPLEKAVWMKKAAAVGYPQAVSIMHSVIEDTTLAQ